MIRINLLPHREAKRKQKQAAFVVLLALGALVGAAIVLMVGGYNATQISIQNERNNVLKQASAQLDEQIAEINTLKDDIEALKARQQAVEDLQADRNQPVYLLDELVRQAPEGVQLRTVKQDGQRVVLGGTAQSQERVAALLRNLSSGSPWLERPDLTEVKAATLGRGGRKVVEFTLSVTIKRPRDAGAETDTEAAGGNAPAAKSKAAGTAGAKS